MINAIRKFGCHVEYVTFQRLNSAANLYKIVDSCHAMGSSFDVYVAHL